MKIERFVTPTWVGHFDLKESTVKDYLDWVKFEKELDPTGAQESTTRNGWQFMFGQWAVEPNWLKAIKPVINSIREEVKCVRVKTVWVVDYEKGGYQDPHFHNIGIANVMTIIINLTGEGDVILQNPNPIAMAQGLGFAEIVHLTPGDWLAFPAYVIHNSRPADMPRGILVMDVFVEDY